MSRASRPRGGWPRLLLGLSLAAAPLAAQTSVSAGEVAAVRRAIDAGNARDREAFLAADAKRLAKVYDQRGSRMGEGGQLL